MWVMVMFDLPTVTRSQRKAYRAFRGYLKRDGYFMIQQSVYVRNVLSRELAMMYCRRIRRMSPAGGDVRVLTFTNKQYGSTHRYVGRKRCTVERSYGQLTLF